MYQEMTHLFLSWFALTVTIFILLCKTQLKHLRNMA